MKTLKVVSSFIFLIIFFGLIFIYGKPSDVTKVPNFVINGVQINVEIALTPEARTQGLSGRASLGEKEGMLFVFDAPGKYGFWMKDMNFPIDIVWFTSSEGNEAGLAPRSLGEVEMTEDLRVVYIKKDAKPESYPEIFMPEENARYVLEVPAGFSDENNLQVGDRAELVY